MSDGIYTDLLVVARDDGDVGSCEITVTADTTEVKLLAPESFAPVDFTMVLLYAVTVLLPESTAKFHAFKAYHSLNREKKHIQDRMTAAAGKPTDELPF